MHRLVGECEERPVPRRLNPALNVCEARACSPYLLPILPSMQVMSHISLQAHPVKRHQYRAQRPAASSTVLQALIVLFKQSTMFHLNILLLLDQEAPRPPIESVCPSAARCACAGCGGSCPALIPWVARATLRPCSSRQLRRRPVSSLPTAPRPASSKLGRLPGALAAARVGLGLPALPGYGVEPCSAPASPEQRAAAASRAL